MPVPKCAEHELSKEVALHALSCGDARVEVAPVITGGMDLWIDETLFDHYETYTACCEFLLTQINSFTE